MTGVPARDGGATKRTSPQPAHALGRIGSPRAVGPLVTCARNNKQVAEVCVAELEVILRRAAADVPTETLRDVAVLDDVTRARYFDSIYQDGAPVEVLEPVDCSVVRQLAADELLRRAA